MKFSIITPSFNQLPYLKRCLASVRDQAVSTDEKKSGTLFRKSNTASEFRPPASGLQIHHHVQDGGSTDGTADWLRQYYAGVSGRRSEDSGQQAEVRSQRSEDGIPHQDLSSGYSFSYASEPDSGMYDALNKGVAFALQKPVDVELPGNRHPATNNCDDSIVGWLNCDEQYLPGTLSFVSDWFAAHPEADMLCGSALLIRPDGELLAFRKAYPLRRFYITASHLYNLSCGMFFRRRVFDQGIHFNVSYRNLGDQEWIMRLLQNGVQAGCTSRFLSAFCFTGQNMSRTETARSEEQDLRGRRPVWVRLLNDPLNLLRWAEKALRGVYWQRPFHYAVYPDGDMVERKTFNIKKASSQWPAK